MKDRVTEASHKFTEGVRWNRPEDSVKYLPKDEQHPFVDRMAAMEDELEFADAEMTSLDLDKKHDRATARMSYTWMLKRHAIIEKTITEQTWEEKNGKWVMLHEVRLRGAPLPLWKERSEVEDDKPYEPKRESPAKWEGATAGGPGPGSK